MTLSTEIHFIPQTCQHHLKTEAGDGRSLEKLQWPLINNFLKGATRFDGGHSGKDMPQYSLRSWLFVGDIHQICAVIALNFHGVCVFLLNHAHSMNAQCNHWRPKLEANLIHQASVKHTGSHRTIVTWSRKQLHTWRQLRSQISECNCKNKLREIGWNKAGTKRSESPKSDLIKKTASYEDDSDHESANLIYNQENISDHQSASEFIAKWNRPKEDHTDKSGQWGLPPFHIKMSKSCSPRKRFAKLFAGRTGPCRKTFDLNKI